MERKILDAPTKPDNATKEQIKAATSKSGSNDLVMCADEYAYKTIEEFEESVGQKVMNDSFRLGWEMARVTMSQLKQLTRKEKST